MKKILLALVSLFAAYRVSAESLESLNVKRLNETEWVEMVRGSDTVMMNLYYVGTASEAVVEISGTMIRAFAPAGTADTTFGTTSSSYSFVTTTASTLGALCGVIDKLANYKCQLRAGRFSDLPDRLRNQAATTGINDLKVDGGFDVLADTGGITGTGGSAGDYAARTNRTEWIRVHHVPLPGQRSVWKKCVTKGSSAQFNLEFSLYGKPRKFESGYVNGVPVASSNTNTSNRSFGPVIVSTVLAKLTLPEPTNAGPVGVTSVTYALVPDEVIFGIPGSGGGFEFGQDVIGIAEIIPVNNGGTTQVVQQDGDDYMWCSGVDR